MAGFLEEISDIGNTDSSADIPRDAPGASGMGDEVNPEGSAP